jgi:hypothetical protein
MRGALGAEVNRVDEEICLFARFRRATEPGISIMAIKPVHVVDCARLRS